MASSATPLPTNTWLQTNPAELLKENGPGLCGICDEYGATVVWFNLRSPAAHRACYAHIGLVEETVQKTIRTLFDRHDYEGRNNSHRKAIAAVQQELGNRSIKQFWVEEGTDKLKEIFDRAGVAAIRDYQR